MVRNERFIVTSSLQNQHLIGVDIYDVLAAAEKVRGRVEQVDSEAKTQRSEHDLKKVSHGTQIVFSPRYCSHLQARLQFARDHLVWDMERSSPVLGRNQDVPSNRRQGVYKRLGKRFAQCCFAKTGLSPL